MGAQGKDLQVQNHNGDWIDAIAEPDELGINVGDMLSRYKQQIEIYYSSSCKPTKRIVGTSRYSVPFFMHPVSDMPLNV
jgi:isopenicillin N synthase-like dioxygenase